MAGGRPKHSRDNPFNPRNRRKPTAKETKIQQQKSLAKKNKNQADERAKEKSEAKEKRPASQFFGSRRRADTSAGEQVSTTIVSEQINIDEGPYPTDNDDDVSEQINNHNDIEEVSDPADDDDDAITINCPTSNNINPNDITANLDIDEEDEAEEEDLDDDDDVPTKKKKSSNTLGLQQKYIRGLQKRIQYEVSCKFPALERPWLRQHLLENHWTTCLKDGPKIAQNLGLKQEHVFYYPRVDFWLPDLQWGPSLMPCCPNCLTNNRVDPHAFHDNHFGRIVVDQTENYYIVSRRYICKTCKERKDGIKKTMIAMAKEKNVEVEIKKVKLQYTFMGWDRRILPLFADGRGKEFPAFLTKRAGLDNSLVDWMRALFDKGPRPQALSNMLLEFHTKEFTRRNIRYERDIIAKKRINPSGVYALFGEFADKLKYNGAVPTGKYLAHVYKLYHELIREYLSKEVKKRGAERLYWDVSYKEAKHLCQYHGQPIFKGLVTAMNEIGKVRVQFHVYMDSHDQRLLLYNHSKEPTPCWDYPGRVYSSQTILKVTRNSLRKYLILFRSSNGYMTPSMTMIRKLYYHALTIRSMKMQPSPCCQSQEKLSMLSMHYEM